MSRKTAPIPVSMPDELVERIDRHVERLNKARPGLALSRSAVIRELVTAALGAAEKKVSKRRVG